MRTDIWVLVDLTHPDIAEAAEVAREKHFSVVPGNNFSSAHNHDDTQALVKIPGGTVEWLKSRPGWPGPVLDYYTEAEDRKSVV